MLDENKAINTKCSWEMKKKIKNSEIFSNFIYISLFEKCYVSDEGASIFYNASHDSIFNLIKITKI